MSEKYQMEIDNFIRRFEKYQNMRIVLYGIGRYTATLLDGIKDCNFNIVGLMDKDPDNVGRVMNNVPVVDKNTVEQIADIVIINTAEIHWNVIYNRIKDIKIPIYYINGEKAEEKENKKEENLFKKLSYSEMLAEAERADVISFDFFDTLFMRSVCSPQDIFRMMEKQLTIPFTQMRDKAKKHIRENYSLDELYARIDEQEDISYEQIMAIKNMEIALEKKLIVPRDRVLSLLKELLERNKEVYIISDMYLSKSFYRDVLDKYEVSVSDKEILLSNELNANKLDGTMWEYYAGRIVRGKRALHIGDNIKADIEKPMEYGIKTYLIPNMWEMFLNSTLKDMASHICNTYETAVMGCILNKLFNDPFVLSGTDGIISICNNYDMGYCVLGPVIMTFMMWLINEMREDDVKKLVVMSKNGSFLKEDYEYLCELMGTEIFSTASYGMVEAMNETDNLICALDKINQGYFRDKEEVNKGVKQFIADYIERFGGLGLEPSLKFADRYYRYCFGGAMEFSENEKEQKIL